MSRKVTIESADTEAKLEFSDVEDDYLTVAFSSAALGASQRIWLDEGDSESLINLFCEMAQNWRGWESPKDWISTEGDFSLSCTSNKLGHIKLELELTGRRTREPWFTKCSINIEAGQLERIATAIMLLFEKRYSS